MVNLFGVEHDFLLGPEKIGERIPVFPAHENLLIMIITLFHSELELSFDFLYLLVLKKSNPE